jgi:hypothetical protein
MGKGKSKNISVSSQSHDTLACTMLTRNQWRCGGNLQQGAGDGGNREDAREEVKIATADGRGGRVEGSDDREGTREGKAIVGTEQAAVDMVAEANYGLRKAWENHNITNPPPLPDHPPYRITPDFLPIPRSITTIFRL